MKTNYPFLERLHRPRTEGTYGCEVGINCYPVGRDRELYQVCSIALLGPLPNTYARDESDGVPTHRLSHTH